MAGHHHRTNYILGTSSNEAVESSSRDEILSALRFNLIKATTRMTHQADKRRTDLSFQVDDWVLLKLQPFR